MEMEMLQPQKKHLLLNLKQSLNRKQNLHLLQKLRLHQNQNLSLPLLSNVHQAPKHCQALLFVSVLVKRTSI
jgi:hypothetical protein